MSEIEKKARALLAAEYTRAGFHGAADDARRATSSPHGEVTIRAIIAALTPPEGYVLVPADTLRPLLRDAITSVEFIAGRAQSKPLSRRVSNRAWELVKAFPARPEVNRG